MAIYVLGHVGILARALVFIACAVLFFRAVSEVSEGTQSGWKRRSVL
jgi:hypothetical protein